MKKEIEKFLKNNDDDKDLIDKKNNQGSK